MVDVTSRKECLRNAESPEHPRERRPEHTPISQSTSGSTSQQSLPAISLFPASTPLHGRCCRKSTPLPINATGLISKKAPKWSELPCLYRFTVLKVLNSGGSNSPWSEFWSEFPHFMGMGLVPAPSILFLDEEPCQPKPPKFKGRRFAP